MATAGDTAFTVSLLEAGDAACGEPAQPWRASGDQPSRWWRAGARGSKGRADRRKPEARELRRLAGARDNKSIAEIGKRHLPRVKALEGFGPKESERGVAGFGDRITLARPVAGAREAGVPAVKRSAQTVLGEARPLLAAKSGSNQSKAFWVVSSVCLNGCAEGSALASWHS